MAEGRDWRGAERSGLGDRARGFHYDCNIAGDEGDGGQGLRKVIDFSSNFRDRGRSSTSGEVAVMDWP